MINQYNNYYWKKASLHVCKTPVIESTGLFYFIFFFLKLSAHKCKHIEILATAFFSHNKSFSKVNYCDQNCLSDLISPVKYQYPYTGDRAKEFLPITSHWKQGQDEATQQSWSNFCEHVDCLPKIRSVMKTEQPLFLERRI